MHFIAYIELNEKFKNVNHEVNGHLKLNIETQNESQLILNREVLFSLYWLQKRIKKSSQ